MKKKLFSIFAVIITCLCSLCLFGCGEKWRWHEAKDSTCEERGNIGYYTIDGSDKYFNKDRVQINESDVFFDALGHDWGDATYVWSQDNSQCTATTICANNNEHVQTETVNTTMAVVQAQTCDDAETVTYTATFTNPMFGTQTKSNIQTKDAFGHDWGEVTYTWSQDNSQCTARRVCLNDETHVQEETVTTTALVTQEQTCENAEITRYTATFTNPAFATQIQENVQTKEALGHAWGEVTYTWSQDNSECTATRVCGNNSEHVETETVNTVANVTQEQSCVNPELTTYTATFTNSAFVTQTMADVQTKEALGHDWGEVAYVWSNNHAQCTATRVCTRNGEHVETETVDSTSDIEQTQTCENAEITRYTAVFTNPAFETQVESNIKTQDSTGHNWGTATYSWSQDYSHCTARRVCVNDSAHVQEETVSTTADVTQEQSCLNPELTRYTATFTNPAFETQIQENVQTQEALGHTWGEVTYSWSQDYSHCTARRVCVNDSAHVQEETVSTTADVTQEQTCENAELTTYTAEFENPAFETQEEIVQTQEALGHDWVVDYYWSQDYSHCTARRYCLNNNEHIDIEETVSAVSVVSQEQTCANEELTQYTATFENPAFEEQMVELETKDPLGHDYNAVVTAPTCTEGGYTTHTCSRCGDIYVDLETEALGHDLVHHDAQDATCTEHGWEAYDTCSRCDYTTYVEIPELGHDYNAVVTAPTCTEGGYTTHTCSRCGDSYVDTQTAALGHNWGAVTYTWSENNSKCTATRVCTRDASHVETETVDTASEVTQEQTCEDIEITRYTATFTNPAFATQTTTDITNEALGHDWSYTYTWSQDNSLCTATRVCGNNGEHTDSEAVNTTSVVLYYQACGSPEITKYTATFTNPAFTTQIKQEQTKPAIEGEHNYVYDADKGRYVCTKCGSEVAPTTSRLRIDGTRVIGTKEITEAELPIVVPYGITEIASHAFEGISISSIVFPDTLRIIGDYAFYECEYLEYFNLPYGLESIGIRAFSRNDRNRMSQLVIPDTVTSIGKYAFYRFKHNIESGNEVSNVPSMSVVLSSSMTVLESGVFGKAKISSFDFNGANIVKIKNESLHYNHLTSITLPATLQMIYDHALNGNHLSTISIAGTQVNDIGLGAFDDQTDITTGDPIQIYTEWQGGYYFGKGENPYYFLVTWDYNVNNEGAENGTLIHSDTKFIASELLNLTLTNASASGWDNRYNINGQYEIKQTVGDVIFVSYPYRPKSGDGKFCLKRVDVVEGKTKSQITTVEFPSYLSDYEYGVLTGFDALTELSVTVGFGRLGNFFTDHSVDLNSDDHDAIVPATLQTVNILGKITEVETRSFQNLTHVKIVNIGSSVTTIARYAFYLCSGLETVNVNNNASLTIGNSAFEECTSLKEFNYNTNYSVDFGEDCFWNTALESFVISSGSTVGNTMLGSCASLMFVYVASNTTITLNGSGNSPFTKCRAVPTDPTSAINLTIYTDGNADGANWCTNWNDTSHSTDPKENDQRVIKPATVVYNTTLEAFNIILENANNA